MSAHKRQQNRALLDAVLRGDIDGARSLLVSGADVDARAPEQGETPLMLAHKSVMLRLLMIVG